MKLSRSPLCSAVFATVLFASLNAAAFAASGAWTSAPSLHTARDGHTATLLPNGNVVVAGGENNNATMTSTEVYSPTTGSWTVSGNLNTARSNANALLLPNGSILVAGGCVSACLSSTTATAEIFNSLNGTWLKIGSMTKARTYFSMVMLANGSVLVAGGCTGLNANGCSGVTPAAEIYNPSTGKWTATGAMTAARGNLTATRLPNGNVLAAGGINAAGNPLGTAELYNPTTGKWTATGKMITARDEHTAVLLATGKVLVAGGENAASVTTIKTELYDPATGKWTASGNLKTSRLEHTCTMLANGNVLITGGNTVTSTTTTVLSSAELYNSTSGVWSTAGSMASPRVGHTTTLLISGTVLAASGSDSNNDLTSAEIYKP